MSKCVKTLPKNIDKDSNSETKRPNRDLGFLTPFALKPKRIFQHTVTQSQCLTLNFALNKTKNKEERVI